jgi:hypothetical protein
MVDDSEINDLSKVYKEMNPDGKKKIIRVAKKLLDGQLLLKDEGLKNESNGTEER